MSGIKNNGGVMWDCIKLEAGQKVVSAVSLPVADRRDAPVEIYTLDGMRVGTFGRLSEVKGLRGIHIYRQGGKTGKLIF